MTALLFLEAANQRCRYNGVFKFEKWRTTGSAALPLAKKLSQQVALYSGCLVTDCGTKKQKQFLLLIADIMREKLEKWRRMKGRRSACHDATTVYNRSKSAVTLDVNKNNKSVYGRSTSAVSLEKKSLKKR